MIGQVLHLKREPDNCKDKYAVAIVLEDCVVGHVPYNLAKCMSQFLSRDANKGLERVTGSKVSRKAGYGLEIYTSRVLSLENEGSGGKTKSRWVFCR